MSRGEIVFDERVNWPASLVAAVVLALLGCLAYMAMQPGPEFEPRPPNAVPRTVDFRAPSALIVAPTTPPLTVPEAPRAPAAAAETQPNEPAPSAANQMPYRFMGKSTEGTESSIVLFGRGRIVTLSRPGPLDDEYVVEAIFDEYLVLRHVPTGVGKFLEYARRHQVIEPPRDPEDSPRD
jgi:hypothetical protein